MKRIIYTVLVFGITALLQSGCKTENEVSSIKMNWEKQTLSIQANKQSLSSVLSQLDKQEGILVKPENFTDREVTVTINEQPINAALVQLIGSERFILNSKNHELETGGKEGAKKDKKKVFPEGKKQKYAVRDTSAVKPSLPLENVKPKADDIKMVESDGSSGSKRASSSLSASIDKKFTKQEKKGPLTQDKDKFTRLRFIMDANSIKIEKALILRGKLIVPPVDVRAFIYTIAINNQVVSIGSFDDPLEMHSYFPDSAKEHEVLRAKTGTFDITISGEEVDPDKIKSIAIQIFRSDNISSPTITLEQFQRMEKSLKPAYTLSLANEIFKIEDNPGN